MGGRGIYIKYWWSKIGFKTSAHPLIMEKISSLAR